MHKKLPRVEYLDSRAASRVSAASAIRWKEFAWVNVPTVWSGNTWGSRISMMESGAPNLGCSGSLASKSSACPLKMSMRDRNHNRLGSRSHWRYQATLVDNCQSVSPSLVCDPVRAWMVVLRRAVTVLRDWPPLDDCPAVRSAASKAVCDIWNNYARILRR